MATRVQEKPKTSPPPEPKARRELPINAEYGDKAKAVLRQAIKDADADYEALAAKLNEMGVEISARGLENKISRGGFSAAFLLQCLDALGAELTDS